MTQPITLTDTEREALSFAVNDFMGNYELRHIEAAKEMIAKGLTKRVRSDMSRWYQATPEGVAWLENYNRTREQTELEIVTVQLRRLLKACKPLAEIWGQEGASSRDLERLCMDAIPAIVAIIEDIEGVEPPK